MDASTVDRLEQADILVVGDVLLDRFVTGAVGRISREAPVPVLARGPSQVHPGGACNVAANIMSLGGRTTLVGLVGADEAARELWEVCARFPRLTAELVPDPGRRTSVKTRFLSGWHQLLCVDADDRHDVEGEALARLTATARTALDDADALILSDYGRGALSPATIGELIGAARDAGLPVVVDPRHDDPAVYAGATVVTPNLGEMERFTGIHATTDEEAVAACAAVLKRVDLDAVLLTRGPAGMTLVQRGREAEPFHVAALTHEVFDVTGAGDTVVSVLAAALAAGFAMEDGVRMANLAAGIVVAKPGTAVVHPGELAQALGDAREHGVVPRGEAADTVRLWQSLGLTVGFTNGCFDLLHRGHLYSLQQAAARADRLVVGLNSDASTARLKGPSRPVQDQDARGAILAALRFVDLVVVFEEDTPEELIRALDPDMLFKGADYAGQDIPGGAYVASRGGTVAFLPLLEGFSTTDTIRRIEDVSDD